MTLKEDFYEIVNVQDGGFVEEAISDGVKTYLEKLGFNTDVISFNINIEMHVNSDRIKNYKANADIFLSNYCSLINSELNSSTNDAELIEEYEKELEVVTDFLDEYK